ncbi:MAG: acyl-CoA carboxylase epsilon subunit [Kineosporiaceae bacterium]
MTAGDLGRADADRVRPTLRVVAGDATLEEIAAVVAAVAAAAPPEPPSAESATTSIWATRSSAHRQIRAMFTPSPHGWRTSFWPR